MSKDPQAKVREVIAKVRAAFPNLPPRQRKPGEDPHVAEIEELGELYKYVFSLCSPARKLELLEMAEPAFPGCGTSLRPNCAVAAGRQKKASKAGQIGEIQSENVNSGPQQAYRRHGRELNGALQFVVHFGFSPQPAMGLKIGRDHTHENADLADRGCADWRRGIAARYRLSVFNFAPTWDQFNLISILTPRRQFPGRLSRNFCMRLSRHV